MGAAKDLPVFSGDTVIDLVCKEVQSRTGVQLGAKQRPMVESRLKKRISDLKLGGFEGYAEYLQRHREAEFHELISLLTTHHTYFFREFTQFEQLLEHVLPSLIPIVRSRPDKTLRVWSAACSRGQELYSLAMFFSYHLPKIAPDLRFKILGTDIDPQSVKVADNGVYHRREIIEVPMNYLGNHWSKGTGDIAEYVKAKPTLRASIDLSVANLLDLSSLKTAEKFDVVFCRNVFIYFTPEQIQKSTLQILEKMRPEGYFFIGVSETLHGLDVGLKSAGPSTYTRPLVGNSAAQNPAPPLKSPSGQVGKSIPVGASRPQGIVQTLPSPIKILVVDDSPSIHTLMKRIFSEDTGFKIVGFAKNGLEADELVKKGGIDALTLDIHMPEQDGITYLKKSFGVTHPPVVMVSSVSRDASDLALEALKLGASDFVEKPALNNLAEKADEIKSKLRSALRAKISGVTAVKDHSKDYSLDQSFSKNSSIPDAHKKSRWIFANVADRNKISAMIKEIHANDPPTLFVLEGTEGAIQAAGKLFTQITGKKIGFVVPGSPHSPEKGAVYFVGTGADFDAAIKNYEMKKAAMLVLGEPAPKMCELVLNLGSPYLLLEDLGKGQGAKSLQEIATDVFPSTSFIPISRDYFTK